MKKFSRCVLLLILTLVVSSVAGYMYYDKTSVVMYKSETKIVVTPGQENEASIRAKNGSLNNDFQIVFKSDSVISAAKKSVGTNENLAQYIHVSSPADSNIIILTCVNPDQRTAKKYVDAVARAAIKTTDIVSVKSMQILEAGTETGVGFKPDLYRNTFYIAAVSTGACLVLEILVLLMMGAFAPAKDDDDDEYEYRRRFEDDSDKNVRGNVKSDNRSIDNAKEDEKRRNSEKKTGKNSKKASEQDEDDPFDGKLSDNIKKGLAALYDEDESEEEVDDGIIYEDDELPDDDELLDDDDDELPDDELLDDDDDELSDDDDELLDDDDDELSDDDDELSDDDDDELSDDEIIAPESERKNVQEAAITLEQAGVKEVAGKIKILGTIKK